MTGNPSTQPPRSAHNSAPGFRDVLPTHLARLGLTLLPAALVVLQYAYFKPLLPVWGMHLLQGLALLGYGLAILHPRFLNKNSADTPQSRWFTLTLLALALIGIVLSLVFSIDPYWHLVEGVSVWLFFMEAWRLNVVLSRALARPGLLLPMSFALLILIGTPLLMTPRATPHVFDPGTNAYVSAGEPITFSEALFTTTSAVCVTGLTVRDTARDFTPFGQAIIGIMIQLGGLGIIIFGSMLASLLGQTLSLKENLSLSDMLNDQPMHRLHSFIRFIVLTTIAIELIGAAALYPLWTDPPGAALTSAQRAGMSLFHAVSAFCNAGFDITGHSLVDYRHAMLTHAIILPLIVVGGLGFPALENIFNVVRARLKAKLFYRPVRAGKPVDLTQSRLSLHTKIVLAATACLYLWGVVTIGAGQLMPYLHESMQQGVTAHVQRPDSLTLSSFGGVLADASFMSVTSRTAGFNSIPMDELQPAGRFSVMTLMMVGGSPGSTAGGFKTTVIALLALSVVATVRQRPRTEAFGRTIADSLVRKAATIGLCYLLLVTTSTMLLCLSEPFTFQSLAFEAISASTTTGLSLGITSDLTGFGQAVMIATMFLGRVGPLALLGAMTFARASERPYRYPHEAVALG